MAKEFLGSGFHFPLGVDETGALALSKEEEKIRSAIWLILSTAKGERLMLPDFGCRIYDMIFGVNDTATASKVASEVSEALVNWEPRIDLLEVQARPDTVDPAKLLINIEYRVRATNTVFNLVYPFYLERG